MKKSKNIYFVCDGGMGSSALGASLLRKKLKQLGMEEVVRNTSIANVPDSCDIIVAHKGFYEQIKNKYPDKTIYVVDEFIDDNNYERIAKKIMAENKEILKKEHILLNCKSVPSDEAIVSIGNMLMNAGYIKEPYIEGMLNRDHSLTTFIGNMIAIPHGEYEVKQYVDETGLAVMIYPDGIDWHGEEVKIVIGIAAKNDDHMEILANIACKLCEMEVVDSIVASQDVDYIYNVLTKED